MNTEPLDPVAEFSYLLVTVAYNNSNWVALYQNLWKSRSFRGVVGKVVKKMGANVRAQGVIYK